MAAPVDWAGKLQGEWSLRPAGSETATAVMRFDEDGTVVNTAVQAFGHYYFLPDNRLLIEFSDSIILGELKSEGEMVLLSGSIAAPQALNFVFTPATEQASAEAEESIRKATEQQQRLQFAYLERAIKNNLRQFVSAAQQYMLDAGVSNVTYEDIVGPGKLLDELTPLNGEDYTGLNVTIDDISITVTDADGNTVSYSF